MSPVRRALLRLTAVWIFEREPPGQSKCCRLWTRQLANSCDVVTETRLFCPCRSDPGERPYVVKTQDSYSTVFPAGVLRVSRMEPLTLQPHQPTRSSRPDKLWCQPHPRSLATEASRERHPLTSSLIIRDGREPLWVLSNSIQEFSQPVQSSLDKLTPCPSTAPDPPLNTLAGLTWRFRCVLTHNPPVRPQSRLHTSSEKSRERREK